MSEKNTPVDPMRSEAARVARYAEAMVQAVRDHMELPDADVMWNYSIVKAADIQAAAVVAVVDEEHAALVAKVERLRSALARRLDGEVARQRLLSKAVVALEAECAFLHSNADTLRAQADVLVAKHEGGSGAYWAEWHRTHCAAAEAGKAEVDLLDAALWERTEERDRWMRIAQDEALADAPAEQPRPTFEQLLSDPTEQFDKDGEVGRLILGGSALSQFQAEAYQAGECGHLIERDVQTTTASVHPARPSKWIADLCGLPRDHTGEHVGRMSLPAEQATPRGHRDCIDCDSGVVEWHRARSGRVNRLRTPEEREAALMAAEQRAEGKADHRLNEHGTTDCPVERVRATADDEDGVLLCSACGAVVAPRNRAAEATA